MKTRANVTTALTDAINASGDDPATGTVEADRELAQAQAAKAKSDAHSAVS